MKKSLWLIAIITLGFFCYSFRYEAATPPYRNLYEERMKILAKSTDTLLEFVAAADLSDAEVVNTIRNHIARARLAMKAADIWLRYLDPLAQKLINGPLAVEWETEAFEKYEPPYRREGAGFTLAFQCLESRPVDRAQLIAYLQKARDAVDVFLADSVMSRLADADHFLLCNRLFLLHLAATYTTGFDNADATTVITELRYMLKQNRVVYERYNASFPEKPLTIAYLERYDSLLSFVGNQSDDLTAFDHYSFLREYINPLFMINQQLIVRYQVTSRSMMDYALNKKALSLFDKKLYHAQNAKGVFLRVTDTTVLQQIQELGKLLFFDPLLSGNNQRSCASCHMPEQSFTDTACRTSLHYDRQNFLTRNSPSLLNVTYQHLLMYDGKHTNPDLQARAVISNPDEMKGSESEALRKILSCPSYKAAFQKLLPFTPQQPEISMAHITSALSFYYAQNDGARSLFDNAMDGQVQLDDRQRHGFNLFMGKAQCGTCHFVPQFNGVKPPFLGSEFEVIGVPADTGFSKLSADPGRYEWLNAAEMQHAFRTSTLRNAARTAPYMHNGVFRTLEEVIDFYDAGGGVGHGLTVPNQTLSADSLKLTQAEKSDLILFLHTLNEAELQDTRPPALPASGIKAFNRRKPGGDY